MFGGSVVGYPPENVSLFLCVNDIKTTESTISHMIGMQLIIFFLAK